MAKKPSNHGKAWSGNDIKQMERLQKQNTPTPLMAYRLGRTVDAVRSKAQEIGNGSLTKTRQQVSLQQTERKVAMYQSRAGANIGRAGEQFIVNLLRTHGWFVENWNTQGAGATDIVASKSWTRVLIQVKSSVAPNYPAPASEVERYAICGRAKRNGCQVYLAQVLLDPYTYRPTWWQFVPLE